MLTSILIALAGAGVGAAMAGMAVALLLRPEEEAAADPDEVQLDLRYTCHPEQFFRRLERDLAALDPSRRVSVSVTVHVIQGWPDVAQKHLTFGPVYGQAADAADSVRALMMDDHSPLVQKTDRNVRQDTFKEIRAWSKKSNLDRYWLDSDSPLVLQVSGTVRVGPGEAETSEVALDPEKLKAEQEVDAIMKRHQAILHSREKEGP